MKRQTYWGVLSFRLQDRGLKKIRNSLRKKIVLRGRHLALERCFIVQNNDEASSELNEKISVGITTFQKESDAFAQGNKAGAHAHKVSIEEGKK